MFFWIIRIIFWLPIKLFFPSKVVGRKNLIKSKCVMVCNHQSLLDAPLMLVNTNFIFHTMMKKELAKNWLLRWFFKHLRAIPVDREGNDISAIKQSIKVLNNNKPLLVFPSGTRKKEEEKIEDFKNGASMLAYKTKSQIVPIVFSRKPKLFRMTKIIVGNPIDTISFSGNNKNEIYNEITKEIENRMNEMLAKEKEKKC